MFFLQEQQHSRILFQINSVPPLSASDIWTRIRFLRLQSVEIVKRDGPHPYLLVGHYSRNSRPKSSNVKKRFEVVELDFRGLFQKIKNPAGEILETDPNYELHFVEFPVDSAGVLVESDDITCLCRTFNDIENNVAGSIYYGLHEYFDQAEFNRLQGIENTAILKSKQRSDPRTQLHLSEAVIASVQLEPDGELISQEEYYRMKEENKDLKRRQTLDTEFWGRLIEERNTLLVESVVKEIQAIAPMVKESAVAVIQAIVTVVKESVADVIQANEFAAVTAQSVVSSVVAHEADRVISEKGFLEKQARKEIAESKAILNSRRQTEKGNFTKENNELQRENDKLKAKIGKVERKIISIQQKNVELNAELQVRLPIQGMIGDTAVLTHLLGVPGYSQFPDFVRTIHDYQLAKKSPNVHRRPDLPILPVSLDTLRRHYDVLLPLARQKRANCTTSVDKLRYALGMLAGPIWSEKSFKKLQKALCDQIEHLSAQLQIEVAEDLSLE